MISTSLARCLILLTAISVCSTGHAELALSTDGSGSVAIVPHYLTGNSVQTLLSVTNERDGLKAVKVRLLEQANGREIAWLNLYLGPFDNWTAAIHRDPQGIVRILSNDRSCTIPSVAPSADLGRAVDLRFIEGANQDLARPDRTRTFEGHIEVIEMGVLPIEPSVDANGDVDESATCDLLTAGWAPGGSFSTGQVQAQVPTGGLKVTASLVDIDEGVGFDVPVTHLTGFASVGRHDPPDSVRPTLAEPVTDSSTGAVHTRVIDAEGRVIRSTWPMERAIDAVSAVLMTTRLSGRYTREAGFDAETDQVVSLPTRRYYTDGAQGGYLAQGSAAIAPFTRAFDPELLDADGAFARDMSGCEIPNGEIRCITGQTGVSIWLNLDPVPPPAERDDSAPLCGSVQVMRLGGWPADTVFPRPGALDSERAIIGMATLSCDAHRPLSPVQGTISLVLDLAYPAVGERGPRPTLRPSLEGHQFHGLPAIGYAAIRFRNQNARPGVLANFASTHPLTSHVRCTQADGGNCSTD